MSTLLWPELAREKAGSYSRVAASLEEELRQIEDLRSKEDGREALKRRAARGARWAMADTLRSEAEILDFWRSTLDIFKEGVGDVPSNEMLQNVRDIIENWLRLARNSREMLRLAAALGHPPEGLEELSAAEVEVGQV
jgi:hypothetical protein